MVLKKKSAHVFLIFTYQVCAHCVVPSGALIDMVHTVVSDRTGNVMPAAVIVHRFHEVDLGREICWRGRRWHATQTGIPRPHNDGLHSISRLIAFELAMESTRVLAVISLSIPYY